MSRDGDGAGIVPLFACFFCIVATISDYVRAQEEYDIETGSPDQTETDPVSSSGSEDQSSLSFSETEEKYTDSEESVEEEKEDVEMSNMCSSMTEGATQGTSDDWHKI